MNKEEKEIIERIQQDSTFRERELLRIIKKQQAEIEQCKSNVKAKNERLLEYAEELEKKDKIIDYMAKTINEAYFASGDFEVWFEDEICKVQRYEDYTYVEKDIKQYFERGTK